MKTLQNQTYLIAYIISNILAILFLFISIIWPRIGRLLFLILFTWASWANWNMTLKNPEDYLQYADLSFLQIYKDFIMGWFKDHLQLSVGLIATSQALIAFLLMLKGRLYALGLIGGILFLIAIIPFGVGSAFPCTLILAIALFMLRHQNAFIWKLQDEKYLISSK